MADNTTQQCSDTDCERARKTRGFCALHYNRMWKSGAISISSNDSSISSIARDFVLENWDGLLPKIESRSLLILKVGMDSSCWVWGHNTDHGYPRINVNEQGSYRAFAVHRISLSARLKRTIHKNMNVHHICSNRRCVNPLHLQEATASENMAEMSARKFFEKRIKELEITNQKLMEENNFLRNLNNSSLQKGQSIG